MAVVFISLLFHLAVWSVKSCGKLHETSSSRDLRSQSISTRTPDTAEAQLFRLPAVARAKTNQSEIVQEIIIFKYRAVFKLPSISTFDPVSFAGGYRDSIQQTHSHMAMCPSKE